MEKRLIVKPVSVSRAVLDTALRVAGKAGFLVERVDGAAVVAYGADSATVRGGRVEGCGSVALSVSMLILSSGAAHAMKRFMRSVKLGYRRYGALLESWAVGRSDGAVLAVYPLDQSMVRVEYTVQQHLYNLSAGLQSLGFAVMELPQVTRA